MRGSPWKLSGAVMFAVVLALASAAPASAGKYLKTAEYPDLSTFKCRTDAIPIYPGQNLNLFAQTKTCPNARKVSGPAPASTFDPGSTAEGYVTRFKPSMQEITPDGLVTPSVWDLHLHHVVWLGSGQRFASGEEKTIVKMPQGYGGKVGADQDWNLNYMIHSLNSSSDREVYITWTIDWVPETDPPRTDITATNTRWLDVAGAPQVYPVFDAERGFDTDGDAKFTFPDEVLDPSDPGHAEEEPKASSQARWVIPAGGVNLIFGAGHLHPGGEIVDLEVARDGDDAGTVDGDDPAEVKPLFRSMAKYYEPAGAVSWDVSMQATRPSWRISLQAGDTVSIDTTYDVRKASWYESMGILPLAYSAEDDPKAKDPFDDAAAVEEMYERGGILTHGRLPENVDAKARKDLGLPDPRDLRARGTVSESGIDIDGFRYKPQGGFSATKFASKQGMRPPAIDVGETVEFNNLDVLDTDLLPDIVSPLPQAQQAWHSVTSCKPPCNRGSGIGYPLAGGPVKFDSGQLGYSTSACGAGTGIACLNGNVVTDSHTWETPQFTEPGTYTYFCRIHPFMRGSVRVEEN